MPGARLALVSERQELPEPDHRKPPSAWSAIAFISILLLAASLRLWRLEQNGFGTPYYAAAVRSMAMNWHNFFYCAFDPAGFLAIDKPPIAFWLQVASVRLLGFNGFAVHLPQVVEGVVAVALLYHLVRRSFGPGAGLLAALFLAITPISVAVDRSNNTDSCLVLTQLLAAWPLILATERARLPLLLLSAVLLGVSFNVKMAAALVVLPGFIALYACAAPNPWWRRLAHLMVAAAVLIVVSFSWPTAVDLTPGEARPYVDSTRGNSMLELAIGHNALDRFVRPDWLRIVVPANGPAPHVAAGPLRLAAPPLASQMAWLAPLALAGLWFCRAWHARLLWGLWACVCLIVYSAAAGIFLPHYLADMAPPLAALAAIGVTSLRRRRDAALVIALSVAWQVYIVWGDDGAWRDWLIGIPVGAALIATLLLRVDRAMLRKPAIALSVSGLLLAPLAWSIGPVLARGNPTSPMARLTVTNLNSLVSRSPPPAGDGLANRTRLLTFLSKQHSSANFVLATTAMSEASSIIIRTGDPVIALGGYTGTTPVVSQNELARRVGSGQIRFVLIGGAAAADPASPLYPLVKWMRDAGREINPALWRPPIPSGMEPGVQRRATWLQGLSLYDLRPD